MPVGVLRAALLCSAMLLACSTIAQAQASPDASNDQFERDDQEARDLFKLGKQAFDEGRFERALMYFKDAYVLSRRAALLSNIGSALDRLRRDDEALEAYKSYLEQVPDAPNRAFVEERVRVIEAARPKAAPPSAATEPAAHAAQDSSPAPLIVAPTPEQTAQAAPAIQPKPVPMTAAVSDDSKSDSPSLTSRWWFWAGIGAVAAAAVVVGVSVGSSGGTRAEAPALASSDTHVRAL